MEGGRENALGCFQLPSTSEFCFFSYLSCGISNNDDDGGGEGGLVASSQVN